MLPSVIQNVWIASEDYTGYDLTYPDNVASGNVLLGFTQYTYGAVSGLPVLTDTIGNAWVALNDPATNPGNLRNSAMGYAVNQFSGSDTIPFPVPGQTLAFSETDAFEIQGVDTFDSSSSFYSNGTTSPISGSLTTTSGAVFNFATTTSYPNWYLTLVAFSSSATNGLYVVALCTIGTVDGIVDETGQGVNGVDDTIAGWANLQAYPADNGPKYGFGFYSGIYGIAQAGTGKVNFPVRQFFYPNGNPLAYGTAAIGISKDAQFSGGQLCAGLPAKIPLDINGSMISPPKVWPNAQLSPTDSVYILTADAEDGQRVLGPDGVTV